MFPDSRVLATVYTHAGSVHELTPYLTGYQIQEHMARVSWPLAVQFKWPADRPDPRRIIADDDWLIVREQGPYGERVHVALVDSVTRSKRVDRSGAVQRAYTIVARHVGKPFEVHEFRFDANLPTLPGMLSANMETVARVLTPSEYAPRDILRHLFEEVFRPRRIIKATPLPNEPTPPQAPAIPQKPPAPSPLKEGQLTTNFHIREFLIPGDDPPDATQKANLATLAGHLQTLRDNYFNNAAVTITPAGGFRSKRAQQKINPSAPRSRHLLGKAADIRVAGLTPLQVAEKISDAIAAGDLPASFGVIFYATFVHYDIGETGDGGDTRPIWAKGKPTNPALVPSAADVAAFLALKPVPGAGTVETSTDDAPTTDDAIEAEAAPDLSKPEAVEAVPGQSGDGAFAVPGPLAARALATNRPTTTAAGRPLGNMPRWDWLDVLDLATYNDPSNGIRGRWWQLSTLYQMGKSTVDAFVRGQADPVFCELFYDTRRVANGSASKLARLTGGWAPVVVFRRRPLDKADWDALPACTLRWGDLLAEDLGRGGTERFNYFFARPPATSEVTGPIWDEMVGGGAGRIPAIDAPRIYPHGLRSMDVEARFLFSPEFVGALDDQTLTEEEIEDLTGGGYAEQVRDFNETLFRWNHPLPRMFGGSVTVPWLDARALVGHKLLLTDTSDDGDPPSHGYIEGVVKAFQIDPATGAVANAQTQIMVTRLQPLASYLAPEPESWK